jgi:hypothetical protein
MEPTIKNHVQTILLKYRVQKEDADFLVSVADDLGKKQEEKFKYMKDTFLTQKDKTELIKEISDLRSSLSRTVYIVGLAQFLAIIASIIAILKFVAR